MGSKSNRIKIFIPAIVAFISIVTLWELIDHSFKIKEIILPNPHEIFFSFLNNFNLLLYHTSITLLEAFLGFVLATIISFVVATIFTFFPNTKKAFYPYVILIYAAPMLSFAPLIILWFGEGLLSKVVLSSLVAFFPIMVNYMKGLTSLEKESIEFFKLNYATKWQTFIKLRLPNSLIYTFPSLKVSSTLAVAGAVIAEFASATKGIGYLITKQ